CIPPDAPNCHTYFFTAPKLTEKSLDSSARPVVKRTHVFYGDSHIKIYAGKNRSVDGFIFYSARIF
ncbi:MAG TPA: hypothetical protein PKM20_09355, partial [Nitrosomonas sp.]|nr:hypothetical protein [Nitrosomonas sp.]